MKKSILSLTVFFLLLTGCSKQSGTGSASGEYPVPGSSDSEVIDNTEETPVPEPMDVEEETEIDLGEGEEDVGM